MGNRTKQFSDLYRIEGLRLLPLDGTESNLVPQLATRWHFSNKIYHQFKILQAQQCLLHKLHVKWIAKTLKSCSKWHLVLPTINNFPPTISKLLTKLLSRQELGLSCILENLYVEGSNVHRVRDKCNKNNIKMSEVQTNLEK